jgi:hypothetical protein
MPEQLPIYLVMVHDRHAEPDCEVFATLEWAIGYAQRVAARYPDAEEQPIEGWLYHANLTVEGDAVWVIKKDLHADDTPTATGWGDVRKLEAPGSILCDCDAGSDDDPPTNPKTGARMDHHCDCMAVTAVAQLLGETKTIHYQQCDHYPGDWMEVSNV